MKKLALTLTFLFAMLCVAHAQRDEQFQKTYLEAYNAYMSNDYQTALDKWDALSKEREAAGTAGDSIYINLLVVKAKCLFRTDRLKDAIDCTQRAIQLWETRYDMHGSMYAMLLDNLSLYLLSDNRAQEALGYAKRSIDIYDSFLSNTHDKAIVLEHLAEACCELKKYSDAQRYELQALSILKNELGEHSEEYLNELPYLSKYYTEAGMEKAAADVDQQVERLKKEADEGYGDFPDFSNGIADTTQFLNDKKTVLRCANFVLQHTVDARDMGAAMFAVCQWGMLSHDVKICIGMEESKLLKDEGLSTACFYAYQASCVRYAIDNGEKDFTADMYMTAIVDMTNFYLANQRLYGEKAKIALLDKYYNAYTKGGHEALEKLVDKQYEKIVALQNQ